ncbi:metallophosphoesterase [Dictyobacter formicarum]|uniref:Serine/threonine protein phosphatase n=1 Tax=Dictyobacter formicarum TaxID=2778368 RepID=A0ABQ3V9L5_9CHLR|nr:metallophosphoesterase [Dictyobacter formicarum]GHO82817.1 serine/threonine protein phosphatase [Dictyobacter formicarum]
MQVEAPVYVMGDIHGHLPALHRILQEAHLINKDHHWTGGEASLWFMGDLVDRGPDSIGVLDFVIQLQQEAQEMSGHVDCLLGNHELLLLAAYYFGWRSTELSNSFITKWRHNGGKKSDLIGLTQVHLTWLTDRPAMALVGNILLIHADATFYTRYGHSIAEVNETFKKLMKSSNTLAWEELIEAFAMREVFSYPHTGKEFAERFLSIFGGKQIIHGHTPIQMMSGGPARNVTQPFVYANGQCVNVDGGIYMGGSGFIYQLTNF